LEQGKTEEEISILLKKIEKKTCLPTKTTVNYVSGSVEAACALGLADAIGKNF
jgi:hypothetical protein